MNDSLSKRLADALLELSVEENKVDAYKAAILKISSLTSEQISLKNYLESYFVLLAQKEQIIDEICRDYKLKNLANFLKFLAKRHYFGKLHDITKQFVKVANENLGVLEGIIYSVSPLSVDEISKVEDALTKKNKVKVELKNVIDEHLLGGVKVAIHDYVYDGSLRHKLVNMKNSLLEGGTYEN